jgi:DNA-binding IclR family transcriptional regulator
MPIHKSGNLKEQRPGLLRGHWTAGRPKEASMIQSLAKGLDLLEFVALAETPVRLRDVAAHFGLERSSALRVLATLEDCGFLSRHVRSKSYVAGPKLLRIIRRETSNAQLAARLRPHLKRLTELTGMSAALGVLVQDRVLLIDSVAAPGVISVNNGSDALEPLYPSAVGKAILAFLPTPSVESLIDTMEFEALTPNTITDPVVFRDTLGAIRRIGVSFDDGEAHSDICCIAAPILDASGYPIAAIGISGVRALVAQGIATRSDWIDAVRLTAKEASE